MAEAGISEKEALKRVWMVDSRGLIVKVNLIDYALNFKFMWKVCTGYIMCAKIHSSVCFLVNRGHWSITVVSWHVHVLCLSFQNRPSGGVTGPKIRFAQEHAPVDKLVDVVKQVKPTAIIGKHWRSSDAINPWHQNTLNQLYWRSYQQGYETLLLDGTIFLSSFLLRICFLKYVSWLFFCFCSSYEITLVTLYMYYIFDLIAVLIFFMQQN